MERPKERVFRGYLSSADVERLYPARVARIARGKLTYADKGRINEEVSRIDQESRGGHFNGIDYFHFRFSRTGRPDDRFFVAAAAASTCAGKPSGANT